MKLDDTSDSEVALDSLGQFFNNLIDTDPYKDDTRASQAISFPPTQSPYQDTKFDE